MNEDTKGNYAEVNGIELYYEVHGEGDPLVLLHGGVGASEMFGANLPGSPKPGRSSPYTSRLTGTPPTSTAP
jgi:pimeloyl-ACP methyl ester carboxylesterase